MKGLTDIHCHILPYVDDGAERIEETEGLLRMLSGQGVTAVCATPHLRSGMFETEDAEVYRQYERVRRLAAEMRPPVRLYLGREYHCDGGFWARLEGGERPLTLGGGETLLLEFSARHSYEAIYRNVKRLVEAGYRPLIAHGERYPALREREQEIGKLLDLGALLQVNAGSVLGREGLGQKRYSWRLLRRGLVYAVASDAHGTEYRPPELDRCAMKLERRLGEARAAELLREHPMKILSERPKG